MSDEMLTDAELSVLEASEPTLAKFLRSQQQTIQKLDATVADLRTSYEAQAQAEAAELKTEIQAAIDANPTLAAWQVDNDQTMWNEAAKFDRALRESPRYADVPFEERFKKVVELTQAALDVHEERQPARDEEHQAPNGELEEMPVATLGHRFAGMSLDQIEKFLVDLAQADLTG